MRCAERRLTWRATTVDRALLAGAGMRHFLDEPSYPFWLPCAQELHELLWTNIDSVRATRRVLQIASIAPALVDMEQPLYLVWHSVLETAAKQGKLRALLDAVRREPVSGAALAPRIEELSRPDPPVQAAPPPGPVHWGGEAITGGSNTLLDVSFLRIGAERARSVVRLSVSFEDGSSRLGTGFLVRPDVIVSNHHVLCRGDTLPARVVARFDYENTATSEEPGYVEKEADAGSVRGSASADAAFVRLREPENRAPLPLDATAAPLPGDRVYILQHPAGGPKKIGMIHNHVRHVEGDIVQYLTDTLPGSSGSPVFNERWDVIALHHRSVRARGPNGGEELRNQGVRIGAAVAALTSVGL